ncbi:MAG: AsmA family protein, partial [Acidobacteriota bacterium]|nr:AsmA family protein [Acidobacteriota bacterium]
MSHSDSEDGPDALKRRRSFKRRSLWILAAVLAVAALVLTPPLISANRLRRRIAISMSESLGRPVHMDRVTLNILPVPGFTLENLVVSEDPAFGSEPVIRADSVRATLRASSLWRRQVEFATIRFESPSVNLVRRADGRWNIESILLHAAQEDTAPTAQRRPGPAPRFPYIEANGARVNVKMGNEKKPLALTEADFALWLPSPQQWRVRLEAKPARTDTSVFDTGLLTVEATLQRAAHVEAVPIELTAAWRRAPLGEASRVLTGVDAGWRGGVEATATLHGTLGDAAVSGSLKLTDVRRADFIPAKMLNLNVDCSGHLAVATAVMRGPACTLALNKAKPEDGLLVATADTLDLTGLRGSGLKVGMTSVPDAWLLDWARLFSQRIPATFKPKGEVAGSVARVDVQRDFAAGWQGEFHDTVEVVDRNGTAEKARIAPRVFSVIPRDENLTLASV